MAKAQPDKIDLFKLHKDEYAATRKPRLVEVAKASFLAVDGQGAPGAELFQERIGALYGMAYTIKFESKFAGRDYTVGKLEGIWCFDEQEGADLSQVPQEQWRWRMLIRVPDFIKKSSLSAARKALRDKGKEGDFDAVRLESFLEGRCVQMLHVGPYDQEHETIATMRDWAADQGLTFSGWHHEIYLSDPRRVPPERLRTILRHPVRRA